MKISFRYYLLLPICLILFLIIRGFIIFSNGTDLAGIEQNVVYSVQIYLSSGKLYFSPKNIPFSITQYTPIYYYICAFTAKIFSINIDKDFYNIYIIGRVWNLIFNLASAFLTYCLAKRFFNLSKKSCRIIFLLTFSLTFAHNFAVRPDSLHDLIGITSIYTFFSMLVNIRNKKPYYHLVFLTIFLTLLAVFSKQSGIQFIIIFLGITLWNKDWGLFSKMLISTIIVYTLFIYLYTVIYPSFTENVIGGVSNGISIKNYLNYIIGKNIFIIGVWPLIFASLFVIFRYKKIIHIDLIERALAIIILGTLIFALVTALKMGSTVQYFVVFINLSFISLFKEIETNPWLINRKIFSGTFYCYISILLVIFLIIDLKIIYKFDKDPILENQRISAKKTAAFIEKQRKFSTDKYIFFDLTTDYNIPSRQSLNNIFFRNCLVPQMDILQYSTKQLNVIGYKKLEAMLETGQVSYIVESEPKINFSVLKNINEILHKNFKLIKSIDGYLIYEYLPLKNE